MQTIIEDKIETLIIKKSKFITYLKKCVTLDDAKSFLSKIKEEYSDATHVCYAYIIDNNKKYSDDNEPSNTAGKPMFEILEKNNLNYILAIVVRYFGGIKLGSNGLIRAYRESVSLTLQNNLKKLEYGYQIVIDEEYEKSELINYLLKDAIIIQKKYTDRIHIEAIIKKEILENLSNINFQIIKEILL